MRISRIIQSMLLRVVKAPAIKSITKKLFQYSCKQTASGQSNQCPSSILPSNPNGTVLRSDALPVVSSDEWDLSVIIPFYNTAQYAVDCIESVINQTTDYRYELILVDDASPDACPAILDSYGHYENVRVIHKTNGGLSSARNCGIQQAKGAYLMFLDSDDLLCPGAIDALMHNAITSNADIVDGSFRTMTKKGVVKRHYSHKDELSSYGEGMFGYAWGKVYRKSLFNKICFPEGYWFEDTIVSALLFPLAPVTKTISCDVVLYRTNPHGITASSATKPKCIDTFYVLEPIIQACLHLGVPINKRSMLYQLGPYLYGRIQALSKEQIQGVFSLAVSFCEKYQITAIDDPLPYYEQALCEALRSGNFKQWKWASILI